MATPTEVREWAVAEGNATSRGKLRAGVIEQWDAEHPDNPYQPGPPRDGFTGNAPDYPDADFDANFPDPEPLGDTGETPPRRPGSRARVGKTQSGVSNFFNRGKGKAKPGAKKKPRVTTEDLLGSLWRGAAKLATPLPPLQRTLRVQAPVAGVLLEDAVRGTALDIVLQPFARFAGQGKTISAIAGPPILVTALTMHLQIREAAGQPPNPFFMTAGVEALRASLMTWMDIAGPKFAEAMLREKEFEDKYGQDVDTMISWLLSPPVDPRNEAAVEAEEEAIRRAQGIL
jgi:hypothetical protein